MGICSSCKDENETLKKFIINEKVKLEESRLEVERLNKVYNDAMKTLMITQQKLYETRLKSGGTIQNEEGGWEG